MPGIDMIAPFEPVTHGPKHHFFGYYDKCPWDHSGRYLLAMETDFVDRPNTADDTATLCVIDTQDGNRITPIDTVRAWSWQMGCQAQWLPNTEGGPKVLYNQYFKGDGHYSTVIHDLDSGAARTIPRATYCVTPDGRHAWTLNWARLNDTRPGYGYRQMPDPHIDDPTPDDDGIYLIDLTTGESRLVISIRSIAEAAPYECTTTGRHWLNHLFIDPTGTRGSFLHRWPKGATGEARYTALYTANLDGSDVYLLNGPPMTSHCDWLSLRHLLAWATLDRTGKDAYYLWTDRSDKVQIVGEAHFDQDGHCNFSPDRHWILTDTYPSRDSQRTLILYHMASDTRINVGRFYSPRDVWGELRCDLHPRWSRDGTKVCIDSAHEGGRQMFVVDVAEVIATHGG